MARFYSSVEVVESLCLRSGDLLMRNKGLFLDCCTDVWEDMNEDVLKLSTTVKIPVRHVFVVDKRTNSINIPKKSLRIASINTIDRYGCYWPVYRNDNVPIEIVDVGAIADCACENNCNSRLCNTIKGYEAVKSTKSDFLPNMTSISFECVDKKAVDNQGFLYEQSQYPLRVYISGVWTDTVKYTENKKLCKVETDANGCVCDTEANLDLICNVCGISNTAIINGGTSVSPPACAPDAESWRYQCASKMEWFNVQCGGYAYKCGGGYNNIYNISTDGNRIIFPPNFGWGKVMIRFYEDIDLKDIQIPYLAKDCFMTGIQAYAYKHHDDKQQLAALYEQRFGRQKWGLLLELNKYRIAELAAIFTPKVFMPSYIENRHYNNNYNDQRYY